MRKSLGRHEIATIQTTTIDKDVGLLRLTTLLAHSSGEWISSEWPVCAIADIASAQRIGAALTYARRYALFTLVGIAGEDDVDAPNLNATSGPADEEPPRSGHRSQSVGHSGIAARSHGGANVPIHSGSCALTSDESIILRDRLLSQLGAIDSSDEAAIWAHKNLSAKNRLTAEDARIVEEKFRTKLSAIGDWNVDKPSIASALCNVMPISPSTTEAEDIRERSNRLVNRLAMGRSAY